MEKIIKQIASCCSPNLIIEITSGSVKWVGYNAYVEIRMVHKSLVRKLAVKTI
jgi:hypothetical protein